MNGTRIKMKSSNTMYRQQEVALFKSNININPRRGPVVTMSGCGAEVKDTSHDRAIPITVETIPANHLLRAQTVTCRTGTRKTKYPEKKVAAQLILNG